MKNSSTLTFSVLFIATILFFASCNLEKSNPNQVTISGTLTNPSGDSAFIRLMPFFGWDYTIHPAVLDQDGNFSIQFDLDEPTPAQFYDGNEVSQMFLSPGDRLQLTINIPEFDESIHYTGKGAEPNNYLAKKYLEFEAFEAGMWDLADSLDAGQFEKTCRQVQQEQIEMLDAYAATKDPSKEFIEFQKTEIHFQLPVDLFYFIMKNRDYNLKPDTVNVPKRFYELYEEASNYPAPYQKSMEFNNFIRNYEPFIFYSTGLKIKSAAQGDSLFFAEIPKQLKGLSMEKAIATKFNSSLGSYKLGYFDENRKTFDEKVQNQELRDIVLGKYEAIKKELSRPLPENANLIDINDSTHANMSFQDIVDAYNGKVLYLDFWASWCGPCRAEMPFSLDLQEQFSGKDVAFVYISSDAGFEEWESMIRVLQITGDHYRANRKVRKQYNDLFNVRYIPRYVLYDKAGNVVDSTANRPSSKDIVADIEKLLQ